MGTNDFDTDFEQMHAAFLAIVRDWLPAAIAAFDDDPVLTIEQLAGRLGQPPEQTGEQLSHFGTGSSGFEGAITGPDVWADDLRHELATWGD
jgi:hypothetical protein